MQTHDQTGLEIKIKGRDTRWSKIKNIIAATAAAAILSTPASAQTSAEPSSTQPSKQESTSPFHLDVSFLANYGYDGAIAPLGLEMQGRMGYARIKLHGDLGSKFKYVLQLDPVNEIESRPACPEPDFFYPNTPTTHVGPQVDCHPDGRMRVDDYKFIDLGLYNQQGPIEQAYLEYTGKLFSAKFGRFILPKGFTWQEIGAFTSKDSPHILRINSETNFGGAVSFAKRRADKSLLFDAQFAAFLGEGNRNHDYDYFYFLGTDLDTNSLVSILASGRIKPVSNVEIKAAMQKGFTGSKVERVPNYFASKRNDHAVIVGGSYEPIQDVIVFAEMANYTWGPRDSSATMLGLDPAPIEKQGYYFGFDASRQIGSLRVGVSASREELGRDDSLIKYLEHLGLYGAQMGKKERSTTLRGYVDFQTPGFEGGKIKIGGYYNDISNPFPQLSGIHPVSGPKAYRGRQSDKYGVVVQLDVKVH